MDWWIILWTLLVFFISIFKTNLKNRHWDQPETRTKYKQQTSNKPSATKYKKIQERNTRIYKNKIQEIQYIKKIQDRSLTFTFSLSISLSHFHTLPYTIGSQQNVSLSPLSHSDRQTDRQPASVVQFSGSELFFIMF